MQKLVHQSGILSVGPKAHTNLQKEKGIFPSEPWHNTKQETHLGVKHVQP